MSINYGKNICKDEDEEVCIKVRDLMTNICKNEYDDMFKFTIGGIVGGGRKGFLLPQNKYRIRLQEEFE